MRIFASTNLVLLTLINLLQAQPGDQFWDGSMAGNTPNGPVWAIAVSGENVYVGGQFSMVGSVAASNIARWDGNTWQPLASGITGPGGGMVNDITVYNNSVYVGGGFTSAGGSQASHIALWNGSSWNWMQGGLNDEVRVLEVDSTGRVYVGGAFTRAGLGFNQVATYVARWGSGNWNDFSGDFGTVTSLALGNGGLYSVGGGRYLRHNFTTGDWVDVVGSSSSPRINSDGFNVYELAANSVFKRTSPTQVSVLATHNGPANVITPDGPDLYLGGSFTQVEGVDANHLARWDGTQWSPLGSGLSGTTSPLVTSIATSPTAVYVGGHFTSAGGNATPYFAIWRKPGPPVITSQPQRRDVAAGMSAVFQVEVADDFPATFQWAKDGEDIPGATLSALIVTDADENDAGSYTMKASNDVGTVESNPAQLNVDPNPDNLINRALRLDGQGDYVDLGHHAIHQNPGALTVEAWFHPLLSDVNKFGSFINKGDGLGGTSDRTIEFRWNPNEAMGVSVFLNRVTGQPDAAGFGILVPSNTWTHFAVTFNSQAGEVKAYKNGQEVITITSLNGFPIQGRTIRQSSQPLTLGLSPGFNDTHATGLMDELRIWEYTRSGEEIAGSYSCKLTGHEDGLVGYWSFDGGGTDDFTPNQIHGRFAGDAHSELVGVADMPLGQCDQLLIEHVQLQGQTFEAYVSGQLGELIDVEATTDWQTWSPAGTVPNPLGGQSVTESVIPGWKVFRAVTE